MRSTVIFILFTALSIVSYCQTQINDEIVWSFVINDSSGEQINIVSLTDLSRDTSLHRTSNGYHISLTLDATEDYTSFQFEVTSEIQRKVFVSLQANFNPQLYQAYNFNGAVESAEIFRQSPHDVNAWIVESIPMQAVPVVALKKGTLMTVAVSDSPFKYENFSSQEFYPGKGTVRLNSGDNGESPGVQPVKSEVLDLDYNADKTQVFSPGKVLPYYHKVDSKMPHSFSGIVFQSRSNDVKGMRKAITKNVADFFSNGAYKDYFGALAFTTAYMNLRRNDSGKSNYWVIPAVEYGNTQYGRDAFWIATMLPPEYDAECLKSELASVNHFAEYPLFAIIWSYRSFKHGFEIDLDKTQSYVDAVEQRVRDGMYYSFYEGDGRLDFQYWGDLMAFNKDDVITYNQGLFAVAIEMAKELGLKIKSDPTLARKKYLGLYDEKLKYFPVSQQKAVLTPDAILPDLVSQLYLGRPLLSSEQVKNHFDRMVKYAITPYGFKVVSTPTGAYLPLEMYDVPGYKSQVSRGDWVDGEYFRGGSYFLYDNLFLMTAHLHNIPKADSLLQWRIGLDFKLGSTTYEHINTVTGKPNKPNMGWNVAVYAFYRYLADQGRINNELLTYIDTIVDESQITNPQTRP